METAALDIPARERADDEETSVPAVGELGRRLVAGLLAIELVWLGAIGYGISELLR